MENQDILEKNILEEVQKRVFKGEELDGPPKDLVLCYIREILNRLRHYLHISVIPHMLLPVVAAMTCEMIRLEGVNLEDGGQSPQVESVKLGDASFSFRANGTLSEGTFESVARAYKQDLHAYRRMAW